MVPGFGLEVFEQYRQANADAAELGSGQARNRIQRVADAACLGLGVGRQHGVILMKLL